MNIHDSRYKRLFANRTFFRDLVQRFVEEDWIDQLAFERTEYRSREKLKSMIVEAILKHEIHLPGSFGASGKIVSIKANSNVDCAQA